jgi:hypothetical protein
MPDGVTHESLLAGLLVAQGVMGGVDTLVNHELIARLPHRPEARSEIGLHAIREAIYAALFITLAWFSLQGALAALIAALLAAEVLVTACDEFLENRIRVLPQNERVLHVFLALNLGVIIAMVGTALLDGALATGPARLDHGWASWVLSALALGSAAWSMRDLLAFRSLKS